MTAKGNTTLHKGIPVIKDAFVLLVKTEWNAPIVDALEKGCIKILKANHIGYKVMTVPGAIEIPFAIQQHFDFTVNIPDAYIALGTVIRGDTPHFDYVCKYVTEGILQLNLSLAKPVIFGVLTVENEQQAKERIGGIHGHKGEEAAITAIKMIDLNRKIQAQQFEFDIKY
ncbi:MAG: 6,7-dimethyl-8-ribityllumazine synthase [Hydrotalea flava]|uniref:6,7-dimethyl-8-ribityllumazine synthase n=1 Tax=Hydrotalea TaxID=1004300 RepID=UPI0009BFE9C7|nr:MULTISPECIES: 6,7-dimethyl-8-ribityllumazine synthase [Hydrotalea]MBY0347454.1 6,7-dimethyl-8-ribityllumazine synthase [Hydrotalea flava]NIM36391.1 6,7-dimethyl-8-ribityllumazine synthase [Hydrotalea flava]NIM39249.1 6,7-dimethyl-8-ribityllumazine synthase [Hydrotalea flava]NIN04485.1 6,7-dimethyl-8-ribityllumazine synthase [Hydrotalea flava]NIN16110.1 6,7-dimethyl-8-ribityllumazine synthase [Hydrotalea flava]